MAPPKSEPPAGQDQALTGSWGSDALRPEGLGPPRGTASTCTTRGSSWVQGRHVLGTQRAPQGTRASWRSRWAKRKVDAQERLSRSLQQGWRPRALQPASLRASPQLAVPHGHPSKASASRPAPNLHTRVSGHTLHCSLHCRSVLSSQTTLLQSREVTHDQECTQLPHLTGLPAWSRWTALAQPMCPPAAPPSTVQSPLLWSPGPHHKQLHVLELRGKTTRKDSSSCRPGVQQGDSLGGSASEQLPQCPLRPRQPRLLGEAGDFAD